MQLGTGQSGQRRRELFWAVWAVVAAFGTYFCMYAFRRPFTAATFADVTLWGLGFKTVLVTSQVTGYMLSKFVGIKVVAEMPPHRRAVSILVLIAAGEFALVLFGIVPRPWNAVCLFLNGLPLGMVFGMVLGFLEGRQLTEALAAGLCASFILADGAMKSVGAWLLQQGISEYWMPSVAGLLFVPLVGTFVFMLSWIPKPSADDVAARAARSTLTRRDRHALFGRYAAGLLPLIVLYLVVTILRSIRADFAPELWQGLGEAAPPGIFTRSEVFVVLGVLAVNGCAVLVRDNRVAFFAALATCGAGFVLIATSVIGWQSGVLKGFPFMVLVGLGLYLPYVAVHTTVFERLLAMTRDRGNIGFLLYVADSFGYLGYVAVMLSRNLWTVSSDFLGFFLQVCWVATAVSLVSLGLSWRYFARTRGGASLAPKPHLGSEPGGTV